MTARVLTRAEIVQVLADLDGRARAPNARLNAAIFRLACCCGLRRCEIAGLTLADVTTEGAAPGLRIRWQTSKGGAKKRHNRIVPLDVDAATRIFLAGWKAARIKAGAQLDSPLLCDKHGRPLALYAISRRWRTAIRCLGAERVRQLSVHTGRHSFISHCLHAGYSPAQVRDWAGHGNIATTNIYAHALDERLPDLFAPSGPQRVVG